MGDERVGEGAAEPPVCLCLLVSGVRECLWDDITVWIYSVNLTTQLSCLGRFETFFCGSTLEMFVKALNIKFYTKGSDCL